MSQLTSNSQVRVPKIAEIVAGKIRRAIVDGTIGSGEYLPPEAKLIEMFEVSRPTIREAIRILEFENLISVARGARGGARIQGPSASFVSRAMGVALQTRGATLGDIYAARSLIEPLAARLAAETRPKEAAAALRAHIAVEREQLQRSPVIAAYAAEFHRILMEQCGNQTFALVGIALHDLVSKHQQLAHRKHPPEDPSVTLKRSKTGVRSQERLVEFIEAGLGDDAENHWRAHMAKAGEYFLQGLAETSVVDILVEESWT
jgi:GntR family transcriptional regulator, transcriptional repressor for pyruvate dehydrogenase complex